jgi:nucleolar complex protein 2
MGNAEDDEDEQGGGQAKELEVLDWASLKALEKQVVGPVWSVRALKKLIRIFRSAVHIGEVTAKGKGGKAQAQSEAAKAKEAQFRQEVQIHSSKVFNELIRFVLNQAKTIWGHHFKTDAATAAAAKAKKDAAGHSSTPASLALDKHPKWSTLGPVLKAFLGHVLHFLSTLHANAKMSRFVLGSNLEALVPWFEPFHKLSSKLLKELLQFWSEGERDVRIDAFLRIRQMAIELTGANTRGGSSNETMLELALKGMYLTYVRNSKFSSQLTLPVIEFMA